VLDVGIVNFIKKGHNRIPYLLDKVQGYHVDFLYNRHFADDGSPNSQFASSPNDCLPNHC